ncbi:universal stress protein [Mycobacterium antarcticum]|uniref:universal stress protein n=1 Tax=unclassified Mycolicibacterium TaxID=2636767 RepID=UPI0023A31429|nr:MULTISPECIES: universal stress protein [unclassified Mycolicibacterium]BDX33592.1 universal stress protein [Mycolicibacterium sp. TUM20985]GLP82796.1 universal stress protein [Mycolicibacterium sp. TUM20984]
MSNDSAPVVVGVDGTPSSVTAARWAGAIAHASACPLHLVHADPYFGHSMSDAAAAIRAAEIAEQRDTAAAILKAAEEAVRADFDDLSVTTMDFAEPVSAVLSRLSGHARLVVVGGPAVTPAGALLLGSTTLEVARRAMCPLVAWRGVAVAPTVQPLVVGIDGSPHGDAALAAAFALADLFGAPLRVVHCWSTLVALDEAIAPFLTDGSRLEAAERRAVTESVAAWRARYPRVEVTTFVEPYGPSQALLAHAEGAQLIVVGNRGRNALAGVLLGSTTLNLLHHSLVPVVLCHSATA